jgi:transcriptional regulator with XRE-family HTH domain|uniref:XRE family transcriptional regulator n=1 Tax=Leptospirillum ferriphilum TaxID=178606 RepID=A0A7C3LQS7_9BACT
MVYQKSITGNWDPQALGARIRTLRGNMSQTAFAELLGISQEDISRYESGQRVPSVAFLVRLSGIHKVSLDWLVMGEADSGELVAQEKESSLPQERRLIENFRQLGRKDRTLILSIADRLRS